MCVIPPEGFWIAGEMQPLCNIEELAGERIGELTPFIKELYNKIMSMRDVEVKFIDIPNRELCAEYAKKVLVDIEKSGYTSFIVYLLDFSKFLRTLGDERFNELIEFIDKYMEGLTI